MNAIAMGSVYLDKGEGIEYLQSQVDRMRQQQPSEYYLDVICRPEQLAEATKLVGNFYELVADIMPMDRVFVGITCNDMVRPAAMALVLVTSGAQLGVKDINPERKGR